MILEVEAFRQGVSRLEREREAVPPLCGLPSFIKNSFEFFSYVANILCCVTGVELKHFIIAVYSVRDFVVLGTYYEMSYIFLVATDALGCDLGESVTKPNIRTFLIKQKYSH